MSVQAADIASVEPTVGLGRTCPFFDGHKTFASQMGHEITTSASPLGSHYQSRRSKRVCSWFPTLGTAQMPKAYQLRCRLGAQTPNLSKRAEPS